MVQCFKDTTNSNPDEVTQPRDPVNGYTISVSPSRIRFVLLVTLAGLSIVYLLGLYSTFHLNRSNLYGFIDLFHFDGESNVPTWFATLLLLSCSVVLGLIAITKRQEQDRYTRHWFGLSLILLYMAADEGAQFHELWTRPVRELTDGANGWLRYGWIIPGAIIALLVGLTYLRFLVHLPKAVARRFVIAGALFLGGAIGMESVAGWYLTNREDGLGYELIAGAEELLEKVGTILALDTAIWYLSTQSPTLKFAFARNDKRALPA